MSASAWCHGRRKRTPPKCMSATSSSAFYLSTTRTTSAPTISRWPFSAPIWNSALPPAWVQLRRQPVEARCNIAPIAQPVARKTNADLRAIDCALADTGTWNRTGRTRAASEKLLGIVRGIDDVFAVVRRSAAKLQNRKPVRARRRLRGDIARIDSAQPLERRQHSGQTHDCHEQPVVFGLGQRCRRVLLIDRTIVAQAAMFVGGDNSGHEKTRSMRS